MRFSTNRHDFTRAIASSEERGFRIYVRTTEFREDTASAAEGRFFQFSPRVFTPEAARIWPVHHRFSLVFSSVAASHLVHACPLTDGNRLCVSCSPFILTMDEMRLALDRDIKMLLSIQLQQVSLGNIPLHIVTIPTSMNDLAGRGLSRLTQIMDLKTSIYFLKMDELRTICHDLDLPSRGQKRELIHQILKKVLGLTPQNVPLPVTKKSPRKTTYELSSRMVPGVYTNGSASRSFFKKVIGKHFYFSTYGMDWIKDCWKRNYHPTFQEFVDFWKVEYTERMNGKPFKSKPELARVNFFRLTAKNRTISKVALERMWKSERSTHARFVKRELLQFIRVPRKKRNPLASGR